MPIKLFCIPYAGGSKNVYCKFKKYLDENIELCPIELAGRGKKIKEPLYENVAQAVEDIYSQIETKLDGEPFAFFGHSLGSILSYETILKIKREKNLEPIHIFFSASRPPHLIPNVRKIHNFPDSLFIKEILDMGGTNTEVFENEELRRLFLRLLKADFKIIETYVPSDKNEMLNCNISVLCGKYDSIREGEIAEWSDYTNKKCSMREFDGDHFFINTKTEEVVDEINSVLMNIRETVRR